MEQFIIIRVLEDDATRHIVEEVLAVIEKHPVSVGAARNILATASAALNFAPARIGSLPSGEDLRVESPGHRYVLKRSVTDILLRDAACAP